MKKVMTVVIIVLILLFPFMKKTMTPDKVLLVGHQVGDHEFEFTKEIKDKEKIAEFENLFKQVNFLSSEWNEEIYPDMIVQINHKEGYFTRTFHIWINGDEGTAYL